MGLSVGVVSIDYLDEPRPPVSDFLKDLATDPNVGFDDGWGGGWSENTFLEFELSALINHADNWCIERGVSADERTSVIDWVSDLPSPGGYVMLHLNC